MRCGMWENRVNLQFQYDWAGAQLQNKYLLVCKHCLDVPQEQLRAITLPADPVPIYFPSIENFAQDETDYHTVNAVPTTDSIGLPVPPSTLLVTEDCLNVVQTPIGQPVGLNQTAIMPWNGVAQYGVALPLNAINGAGTTIVTVICSAAHNLSTNSQVSIEGLNVAAATGFYSVTVTTANSFTYQTLTPIPAQSLLTAYTLVWTANVGVPYGNAQIPAVAP